MKGVGAGRVVFDCCPFTHVPLVRRSPSSTQGVLLLFDVIVTTNRHVPPLLLNQWGRRSLLAASRSVSVRGVGVSSDDDVRPRRRAVCKLFSRHHLSGERGLDGIVAGAGA